MHPLPKIDGPLIIVDPFVPLVGSDFLVDASPEPLKLTLEAIRRYKGLPWMTREPFTLIFRSPLEVFLLEADYNIRSLEGYGPWNMHITPIVSPPTHRLYQAAFN